VTEWLTLERPRWNGVVEADGRFLSSNSVAKKTDTLGASVESVDT